MRSVDSVRHLGVPFTHAQHHHQSRPRILHWLRHCRAGTSAATSPHMITIYIELGDTEYELEVEYDPGAPPQRDDAGSGPEVALEPFVRYSNTSGWEVTTLGNFTLDYAAMRGLPLPEAERCLEDQVAELCANKWEADYESRWDYGGES